MTDQEKAFFAEKFYFSYSSINKIKYDPTLFYAYYVLQEREEKLDSYLVEGKLLHCLVLQPEVFKDEFVISPAKVPTANTKKLLDWLYINNSERVNDLNNYHHEILSYLLHSNLHQNLKTDEQRIAKIIDEDSIVYWDYKCNSDGKIVIDQETYDRISTASSNCKQNKDFDEIFSMKDDIEFDEYKVYNEKELKYDLRGKNYGLKGILDRFVVNSKSRTVHVYDLKTSSKTNRDFPETIEFYGYWMQAAIYTLLASKFVQDESDDPYQVKFSFVVYDKLNQVCIFDVSDQTLNIWLDRLVQEFDRLDYHYDNNDFKLPYEIRTGRVTL